MEHSLSIAKIFNDSLVGYDSIEGVPKLPELFGFESDKDGFYLALLDAPNSPYFVRKYDFTGHILWNREVSGINKPTYSLVHLATSKDYLFDIKEVNDSSNKLLAMVHKFTKNGNRIDSFIYNLPYLSYINGIDYLGNDVLILSGVRSKDSSQWNGDIFFMGINIMGDSLWYHHIFLHNDTIPTDPSGNDKINNILIIGDDVVIIWKHENLTYLVRMDKNSNVVWQSKIDDNTINFFQLEELADGFCLLGEKNDSVYIYKTDPWGHFSSKEEIKSSQTDLEVYPNPSYGNFNISFSLKKPEKVNIEVYSLSGKKVAQKYYGDLPAGENKLNIDLSDQKPGLYLYRMQIGQDAKFGKLLVR